MADKQAQNTETTFSCYVKGDEIKGWPTIKFPMHTWGVVTLGEKELIIVSGWTRRAKITIPRDSITSVMPGKYLRLSFNSDTYAIGYKKEGSIKKFELLLMYYTPTVICSKVKDYFKIKE